MKHIKTHKINPVYLRKGDSFGLHYAYEEPLGTWHNKYINVDTVTEGMMIDTIIVYETEEGELGLKAGRALVFGEDDGTYKDVPVNPGVTKLIGNRVQK